MLMDKGVLQTYFIQFPKTSSQVGRLETNSFHKEVSGDPKNQILSLREVNNNFLEY